MKSDRKELSIAQTGSRSRPGISEGEARVIAWNSRREREGSGILLTLTARRWTPRFRPADLAPTLAGFAPKRGSSMERQPRDMPCAQSPVHGQRVVAPLVRARDSRGARVPGRPSVTRPVPVSILLCAPFESPGVAGPLAPLRPRQAETYCRDECLTRHPLPRAPGQSPAPKTSFRDGVKDG